MKQPLPEAATAASVINRLVFKFIALAVALGIVLRAAILLNPSTLTAGTPAWLWVWGFVAGAVTDACVMMLMLVPLLCYALSVSTWKLGRPQGYVFLGLLALGWVYLIVPGTALAEFNRSLARVLSWVVVYWAASFALRMFVPKIRGAWSTAWMAVLVTLYVVVLVFNAVGEWLFWDEFTVRYNFIAVDYLIYTSEVIGNIWESYPMVWIIAGIVTVSALVTWALFRREIAMTPVLASRGWRPRIYRVWGGLVAAGLCLWPLGRVNSDAPVTFREFKASGVCSFVDAFFKNEIDYATFYPVNTPGRIEADLSLYIQDAQPAETTVADAPVNIVVVTMESMSADFMARYGNDRGLTPTLDSIYTRGLAFDRLFAAGNRTVRGLEALTLCRPPSPGESIIKRPDNTGYDCVADAVSQMGYTPLFFYGGDSYFDNMESYFSGQGYRVVDKKSYGPGEIEFATVWGVCDEDAYNHMIRELDKAPQPFMAHMMTTSNHRPYTYPDGRIAIPPTAKSRDGGVMYSDYALGRFLDEARRHKWFDNTVFLIVADHCASSAGSTELPLSGYHIPAVVYAPGRIEPRMVGHTVSQIDLMPTLLALLGQPVGNRFYGRDALAPDYRPRAFVATYQDMGFFENDTLTVLSPGRRVRQYVVSGNETDPFAMSPVEKESAGHLSRAVSFYQSSASGKSTAAQ